MHDRRRQVDEIPWAGLATAALVVFSAEAALARLTSVPQDALDLAMSFAVIVSSVILPALVVAGLVRDRAWRGPLLSVVAAVPLVLVTIGIVAPTALYRARAGVATLLALVVAIVAWRVIGYWRTGRAVPSTASIVLVLAGATSLSWAYGDVGLPPLGIVAPLLVLGIALVLASRSRIALTVVAVGAVVLALSPRPPTLGGGDSDAGSVDAGPDIVLIVVDTLRRDAAAEMQSFEKLARRGVSFTEARADSSWTLPAMATVLTGRTIREHGAGRSAAGRWIGIAEPMVTLAERLSAHGYETAAIVNNPALGRSFGFEQGFDVFEHAYDDSRWGLPRGFSVREGRPIVPRLMLLAGLGGRPVTFGAAHIARRAEALLDARSERPLFIWLHFLDCHRPYRRAHQLDLPWSRRVELERGNRERILERREDWAGADGRAALRAGYMHEIGFVDRAIERILDAADRRRDRERLIVLTSDHGEEFFEHDGYEHGHSFYEEVLSIPLLIAGSAAEFPPGSVSAQLAGHVDLAPTLLAAAGLDDKGLPGRRLARASGASFHVAEQFLYGDRGHEAFSVYRPPWKLVSSASGQQLFDLERDPQERHDLVHERPGVVRELRDLVAAVPLVESGPAEASDRDRLDAIRSLGYVD